jgi:hypothetical protein
MPLRKCSVFLQTVTLTPVLSVQFPIGCSPFTPYVFTVQFTEIRWVKLAEIRAILIENALEEACIAQPANAHVATLISLITCETTGLLCCTLESQLIFFV